MSSNRLLAWIGDGTIVLHIDSIALHNRGNGVSSSPHLQASIELYWAYISEIHRPYHLYGSCEYLYTLCWTYWLLLDTAPASLFSVFILFISFGLSAFCCSIPHHLGLYATSVFSTFTMFLPPISYFFFSMYSHWFDHLDTCMLFTIGGWVFYDKTEGLYGLLKIKIRDIEPWSDMERRMLSYCGML